MLSEVSSNAGALTPSSGKPRIHRKLQGDWVELESGDGEHYYANVVTKETSWDPPFACDAPPEKENTTPQLSGYEQAGYERSSLVSKYSTPVRASEPETDTGLVEHTMSMSFFARESNAAADLAALADSSLEPLPLSGAASATSFSPRASAQPPALGETCGVGVLLEQCEEGDGIVIEKVFKGGPAALSHQVHGGDEVVSVNHARVNGRTPADLRRQVVGPIGLPVVLGLRKAADGAHWRRGDLLEVALVRHVTPDANTPGSLHPSAEVLALETELAAALSAAAFHEQQSSARAHEGRALEARVGAAEAEVARLRSDRGRDQGDAGRREVQLKEAADSLKDALRIETNRAASLQERVRELEEGTSLQMEKEARLQMALQQKEARSEDSHADLLQVVSERDAALQLLAEMRARPPASPVPAGGASAVEGEAQARQALAKAQAALEAAVSERERMELRYEEAMEREQRRADQRVQEAVARERATWEKREAEHLEVHDRRAAVTAADARAQLEDLQAQLLATRAPSGTTPFASGTYGTSGTTPFPSSGTPGGGLFATNANGSNNTAAAFKGGNGVMGSPSVAGWVGAPSGGYASTPRAAPQRGSAFHSPHIAPQRLTDAPQHLAPPGYATPSQAQQQQQQQQQQQPASASPGELERYVALLSGEQGLDAQRDAVYQLGHAGVDAAARASILQLPDAVPSLVALLSTQDVVVVRYSTLALGNLAMDSAGRAAMSRGGGALELLTRLVSSGDVDTARYASMAVGNLVLEAECRRALLASGPVVANLVASLASTDKQTVRYAAGALRNVAVEDMGRRQVYAVTGAQERLANLTSSQDPSTARYAAACLKNLTLSHTP